MNGGRVVAGEDGAVEGGVAVMEHSCDRGCHKGRAMPGWQGCDWRDGAVSEAGPCLGVGLWKGVGQ